jgi:3-deoxy-D-arabino-heptulosonate 7-phosphate (DAHP) synthase
MAIQTLSFISLILRPYVEQPISSDGWKYLFSQVDLHRNFDGEIMAFGTMSGEQAWP